MHIAGIALLSARLRKGLLHTRLAFPSSPAPMAINANQMAVFLGRVRSFPRGAMGGTGRKMEKPESARMLGQYAACFQGHHHSR